MTGGPSLVPPQRGQPLGAGSNGHQYISSCNGSASVLSLASLTPKTKV